MKTMAFVVGLALLLLPNQALAGCTTSSYVNQFTGQLIICTTCCTTDPRTGEQVCQIHCGQ